MVLLLFAGCILHAQEKFDRLFFEIKGVKFEMVYVQGGSYLMGSTPEIIQLARIPQQDEVDDMDIVKTYCDEMPRHGVEVKSFYMGQYEVTQELWTAVMGNNPSNFIGKDLPVEQVSYYDVQEFIARLNELTGVTFRLPTEAEWEYAARGGSKSKGYLFPGSNDLMTAGWTQINSESETHPVGMMPPNELGLYDMAGNVWEWCSDWYSPLEYLWHITDHGIRPKYIENDNQLLLWCYNYEHDIVHSLTTEHNLAVRQGYNYEHDIVHSLTGRYPNIEAHNSLTAIDPDEPVRLYGIWHTDFVETTFDPQGRNTGDYRVGRGGSWADEAGKLHTAYRNFWVPDRTISNLGFRLVITYNNSTLSGWMPNQYYIDSIADGKVYTSTTTQNLALQASGTLPHEFSVTPSSKVRFSQGNLQYNAVHNSWRFAEKQTDFIGYDNVEYDEKYPGWIDLFSWGTSGYRDRPPYYFSANAQYYGNGTNKNIDHTSYDWGIYNPIINGGNTRGEWRTLSTYEWNYLFTGRPNAWKLRTQAMVDEVQGLVLLPDNWIERGLDTFQPNKIYQFSDESWKVMERAGAVFLPAAGYGNMRKYTAAQPIESETLIEGVNVAYGTLMPEHHEDIRKKADDAGTPMPETLAEKDFFKRALYRPALESEYGIGAYWTTTHYDKSNAMSVYFTFGQAAFIRTMQRTCRCSVRLVKDVEPVSGNGNTSKRGKSKKTTE